jgi:hypothetical protein
MAAALSVPSAANSNLGHNKPLMVCTRLWKLLDVLPMFRAHPHWRPLSDFISERALARTRLEMPIWMK